jgi:magnesium transporter
MSPSPQRCFVSRPDALRIEPAALEQALAEHAAGGVVWIDMTAPDPDAFQKLADRFALHPLAVSDVFNRDTRPKVEEYDGFLFVVGTAIFIGEASHEVRRTNVNLFLAPRLLLTAHLDPVPALDIVCSHAERSATRMARTADFLLYACLDAIVDDYVLLLDEVRARQDALEYSVFAPQRTSPRWESQLFASRKMLGQMQRLVSWQRHALDHLVFNELDLVPEVTRTHLRDVLDHAVRVDDELERQREILGDLMTAYFAKVSHRTNEVMKILTIVTTLMMPLSFITGIFGMNFEHIPGLRSPLGFWLAMGFMAAVFAAGIYIMRRLRVL